MAARTASEILGSYFLTALVEEIKTSLPDFIPPEFYSIKEEIMGDRARHIRVSGTRQVSKQATYGSVPTRHVMSGLSSQDIRLIHTTEEIALPLEDFRNLHDYTNLNNQMLGLQEIKRQGEQFKALFENHVIAATTSVFANDGKIYYDGDGNMLPTSSGAKLTVDMGVPAANLNQVSACISASWATAGTDIPGDMLRLKDFALQTTGYGLEGGYAMYGINLPKYFAANTSLKEFLFRNQGPSGLDYANAYLMRGEIPDGLMGFKWRRMSGSFFNDQNDTKQTFWDGDRVVFTPIPQKSWWAFAEGQHMVPKTWGISASVEGAVGSWEFQRGLSSYAYPTLPPSPPSVNIVYMRTFMPWLKVANAVMMADTVF